MGIKSTFLISRETAIRVLTAKLYFASNEELSNMLEALKESTYRNYDVVEQPEYDDRAEFNILLINDPRDFEEAGLFDDEDGL